MTVRKCKYACGTDIEWDDTNKQYNDAGSNQKHICPNFKKKSFNNFKQTAQKVEQEITQNPPQQSTFKKNDTLGKIAEVETELRSELRQINTRLARAEGAIQALVKELSFKSGKELANQQYPEEEVVQEDG